MKEHKDTVYVQIICLRLTQIKNGDELYIKSSFIQNNSPILTDTMHIFIMLSKITGHYICILIIKIKLGNVL